MDNFAEDLEAIFFYGDLILAAIVDNTVDNRHLSDGLILAAELELMDSIAWMRAGELTCWEIGEKNLH